ncbi:hypothetical protein DPQ33_01520 [Oceanidesulfovibrio indonesiensis]|uniref:Uncharacterized protein n=1 Tax=Oceanidesulfovibrio indonesiensis TaxID=54767 RepID=A0A7M3MKL1_9BACT|nr:class II fructose-bisphosphate aldolase [Oceanidesulfovibrio indonesiensis]TVM19932.1 hypothetical protein DPQ33_01520 [Oceanidesulfovibrio indonesiensis]
MTESTTTLAAILQDAYTAGYAAPAFVIRSMEHGLSGIEAAASEGAPLVLVLNASDFPASSWKDVCTTLANSARAAYGEDFAFALALQGLDDSSLIPQASTAGFALCAAMDADAGAIRDAGMHALRGSPLDCLAQSSATAGDIFAFEPGHMPELGDLVRATSLLPNIPLALRPDADALAPGEPAEATFFPGREHPIRAAVRTGVCLVIFEADGAPTPQLVAEAARLTAAQGAARLMERSTQSLRES